MSYLHGLDTEHMTPFQSGQQASLGWNAGCRTRGRTLETRSALTVSANMLLGEHWPKRKKLLSPQIEYGRKQHGACGQFNK